MPVHSGGLSTWPPARAYTFEFSTEVSANTAKNSPEKVQREAPYSGYVTEVVIGWPDGADNRVGVRFETRNGEKLLPRNDEDQYIAANDFTHPFSTTEKVEKGDDLVAAFCNQDTTFDHFVNVFVTIVEDK